MDANQKGGRERSPEQSPEQSPESAPKQTQGRTRVQSPEGPHRSSLAKIPHHWIIVFGRPGCGFTGSAVDGLVRDGRFPFVYLSMPGNDRQGWWGFVRDFFQKRGQSLVLPLTFPTVLVWEPNPIVLQSDGLKKYLNQKDLDPKNFDSDFLRAKAAERTDDRSAADLVRNGVDFAWVPSSGK